MCTAWSWRNLSLVKSGEEHLALETSLATIYEFALSITPDRYGCLRYELEPPPARRSLLPARAKKVSLLPVKWANDANERMVTRVRYAFIDTKARVVGHAPVTVYMAELYDT